MERIRIQLPEEFSFSTTLPIRITDLNYGNHVGNDVVLSLLHEARVQYLHHFGLKELAFDGCGLIMAGIAVEYKAELVYGDACTIYVQAGGFERSGFDIHYLAIVEREGKEVVAAKAQTGMICYDYDRKKITTVPQTAMQKLLETPVVPQ